MSSVAEDVVLRCKNLVRKEKLCEEDIRQLSVFINNLTSKNRKLSTQWPLRLLIGPLQNIWEDGEIDHDEYIVLVELLGSIAIASEKELTRNDQSETVKNVRIVRKYYCHRLCRGVLGVEIRLNLAKRIRILIIGSNGGPSRMHGATR